MKLMVYIEEYDEFRECTKKEFTIEKIARKSDLDKLHRMVKYLDRSKVALDILSLLEEKSYISEREFQYITGYSICAICNAIKKLSDFGIIVYEMYNGGKFSNFQYVRKWKLNR